jgi:hypothetical protein
MSERLTPEREARILSELMPDNERAIKDELDALRAELAADRVQLAECFRLSGADPDISDTNELAARAVAEVAQLRRDYDEQGDETEALRRELAAERARPRPALAWQQTENGCDLAWCDEHVGGYWRSIGGWQLAWAAESTRLVATEAEARAALVAAAEAAGFDVSACRANGGEP